VSPAFWQSTRKLLTNSGFYAVAGLFQRGISFLLIPLYARYLTRGEFGAFEQLFQGAAFLFLFVTVGLPWGMVRGYYLGSEKEEDRRKMLGVLCEVMLPVTVVVAGVLVAFAEPIASALFAGEGRSEWVRITGIFFILYSLYQLPTSLYRITQQSAKYTFWSIMTFLIIAVSAVIGIVVLKLGLTGLLLANCIGYGAVGIVLFIRLLPQLRLNLQFERLKPLFALGLPMLPAMIARKSLMFADRFMMPQWHEMDVLGIYSIGARAIQALDVLILVPFLHAWQPLFYSMAKNADAPRFFARISFLFLLLVCNLVLVLALTKSQIVQVLGGGKFAGAEPIMMILVLSVAFNGIQYTISPGIHIKKKLIPEAMIMVGVCLLNLLLNVWLIPPLAGIGAALATTFSYLVYLIGTFLLSQHHYPVGYPWARMANVAVQTTVAWACIQALDTAALRYAVYGVYLLSCVGLDQFRHRDAISLLRRGRKTRVENPAGQDAASA
jgi:O-antigen/teichoic acid export membrane protein